LDETGAKDLIVSSIITINDERGRYNSVSTTVQQTAMMIRPPRSNESGGGDSGKLIGGAKVAGNNVNDANNAVLTQKPMSRPLFMSSSLFADNSDQLGVFDDQYFPEITQESSSSAAGDSNICYASPISAIIHEIQRTNIAAATVGGGGGGNNATTTTMGGMGMNSNIMWTTGDDDGSSDPWAANNYTMGDGVGDYLYSNSERSMLYQSRLGGGGGGGTGLLPTQQSRVDSTTSSAGSGEQVTAADAAENSANIENTNRHTRRLSSRNLSIGSYHPQHQHHRRGRAMAVGAGAGGKYFKNPQHALHLLQDTPQFRFVSPQSTDMNGGSGGIGDGHHHFSRHYAMLQRVLLRQDKSKDYTLMSGGPSSKNSASLAATSGSDYHQTLVRERANQRAASELASLLWTLAHEMSLEGYGGVESQVLTAVFALVHDASSQENRMAGLAA
jgi:hypothetical protein